MSTQTELAKLLDEAHDLLQKIEGVAVNERIRVEDAIQGAKSAVSSMPGPEAPEPAVVVPATAEELAAQHTKDELAAAASVAGVDVVSGDTKADIAEKLVAPVQHAEGTTGT